MFLQVKPAVMRRNHQLEQSLHMVPRMIPFIRPDLLQRSEKHKHLRPEAVSHPLRKRSREAPFRPAPALAIRRRQNYNDWILEGLVGNIVETTVITLH